MEKTEAGDGQSYERLPNGATSVLINDPVQEEEEFSAFLQSYKHYETFLDTKVKKLNEDLVELDFSFLLQPSTRQHQVDSSEDINNELIFKEDTDNLKAIDDLKSWHGPWDHPILSTYIYLKTIKYKGIYAWNLWSFVVLFIMPFVALFVARYYFIPGYTTNAFHEFAHLVASRFLCLLPVPYLALVEAARFTLSYRTPLLYLRELRNVLEALLTIVAGFTVFSFLFMEADTYTPTIAILGPLSALSLLCKIYWTSYSPFSMYLKRIAISFFGYFYLCVGLIVLVKFLFRKKYFSALFSLGNDNSTIDFVIGNNTSPSSVDDAFDDGDERSESNDDYNSLDESGESVLGLIKEVADSVFEMTCYFVIAFMAVCKDIYTFVDPTKRTTVTRVNACNYLEMSRTFTNSYEKHGLGDKRIEDLGIFKQLVMRMSRWLINKQHQQHLHKIEKVCVNWKTGDVSVRVDGDHKVIATISKKRSLDDFRRF